MNVKKAILFDLGNTLVEYFPKWTPVLKESIEQAHVYLTERGLCSLSLDEVWPRVDTENHEARNYRVRPLGRRLQHIFDLTASPGELDGLCRVFMRPTFAFGKCYQDSKPVLREVRAMGLKSAIVSNAPWGCPAYLWHEEIGRHGLPEYVDEVVMCTDVGWRKPARPIFRYAMDKLGCTADECMFVGDDPRWDLAGPRAVGMDAIVIDREGTLSEPGAPVITGLMELIPILRSSGACKT